MPKATVELSAKTDGLRSGLNRARADWKAFRQDIKAQAKTMAVESREAQAGGGISVMGITRANLYAKAVEMGAKAAREAVNNVGDLVDASEQLGVSAETIGRMERVFEGSGAKAEELRKGLLKLNDAQSDVKNGSAESAAKFAELGISADEVKKMKLDDLFYRVADGMAAMGDKGKAGSLALDLIGSKNARMIGVMKGGGDAIKKQMSEVSGAVADANSKAIDDVVDSAASGWSAVKGFVTTAIGGTINAVKDGISDTTKEQEKQVEVSKTATDLSSKRVAAAHAELQAAEKLKDEEKERAELKQESNAMIAEDERDAMSALSIMERQNLLLKRMNDSKREEEKFGKGSIEAEREKVKQMKLQQQLDETRQHKIARQAMNPNERRQAAADERREARRARWAERVVDKKARMKIDDEFRDGRLTRKQRDERLEALRAGDKKGTKTEELLSEIKGVIAKVGDKLGVAK